MTHPESQVEPEREAFEVAAEALGIPNNSVLAWKLCQARAALLPVAAASPSGQSHPYERDQAVSAAAPTVKESLAVPPGMVLVSISDLHAIDRAMQHMGDVLNEMDVVEEGDDDLAAPGFEAIAKLIAAAPNHGASAATFTAS